MKVLHLITELVVGGAQDNTLATVAGLPRPRYEVHLASNPGGCWIGRGREAADKFFLIPSMRREIDLYRDLQALWQIYRLLRKEKYDIIHTHSTKAGILGRLAARLAKTPIIVHTVHGFAWHDYMPPWRCHFYQKLERLASSWSHHIITVSNLNRQEMLQLGIAPANKVVTIYSGINVQTYTKRVDRFRKCKDLDLDPNRPIVGYVARLSEQKAPLDFVEAASRVRAAQPAVQFVMVGDGPLRSQVEQATADLANFHVLGHRDDVPELLSIFDVFALSSLWEGIGRALTEAILMERPVAVTAVNGVPEIVKHGETGMLSPPCRPDLLAANILRLLQNPALAKRLGKNAASQVKPLFDSTAMVQQIDGLYQDRSLVSSRGKSKQIWGG